MIGLLGAQGTGKTTLAKAYAEHVGGIYLDASVTKTIRAAGYDPSCTDYDFSTRLTLQEIILKGVDTIYRAAPAGVQVITDRTPLDMLAYTMAEAIGNRVSPADTDRLEAYVRDCFTVVNKRFSTLILIQPGIPLVEGRDGKAVANRAYMEHLNTIMMGLIADPTLRVPHFYLARHRLDLETRVQDLCFATKQAMNETGMYLQDYLAYGGLLH